MSWLLIRTLSALLAVVLGTVVGRLVGHALNNPALGGGLGAAIGILIVVLVDSMRGRALMEWLRGSQTGPAPRDSGFWGELAYRFERALRSREDDLRTERGRLEQFLSAIEASPNGVILLDANDQIEWCNSVAADHFDLDPLRDRLQRVTNLVRSPAFVSHMQGGKYDEPVTFLGPLGRRTFTVLVRTYGDGMKLVLTQDVTERERAEAMRRDFVANVSHEIRTPLTVLAGFVETMATLPLSETERARVLTLMTQQTDRMQALVSDLLTLALLEGSPRPGAERWVPVPGLMQRAEADAQALSGGRHQINLTGGGDDAEIAGSDTELFSALGNLVTNAVRYTPAGGSVEIRWQRRDDGGGDLEVVDTGVGVAREHLPRLTERFYRVDGSRSRETGGTGLGLSIVKHVVQRHGGEIDVQSEVGRGTRIRLSFPAVRVRQRTLPAALPAFPAVSAVAP